MAKGYIIFTEQVTDPDGIARYATAAGPSVIAAGGTAIIAGSPQRIVEGTWHGDTTVVLEFESIEAARAWYEGDEYQAVIGQRHRAASSNVAMFGGFSPSTSDQ